MHPSPRSTIPGANALLHRNWLTRFSRRHSWKSRGVNSSSGAILNVSPHVAPALFTRMSTRPNASATCAAIPCTCSESRTSASTPSDLRPSASISCTTGSTGRWMRSVPPATASGSRATIATSAPCSASVSAIPRPMPWLPPVTTATLPVRSNFGIPAPLPHGDSAARLHQNSPVYPLSSSASRARTRGPTTPISTPIGAMNRNTAPIA